MISVLIINISLLITLASNVDLLVEFAVSIALWYNELKID